MAEVTTMVLTVVDLQCCKNRKKVKKLLCKFPEIQDQVYDEKKNTVTIKVVGCCPERLMQKIRCKGCKLIMCITIPPPPPPPKEKPTPEPPKSDPKPPPCGEPCKQCVCGKLVRCECYYTREVYHSWCGGRGGCGSGCDRGCGSGCDRGCDRGCGSGCDRGCGSGCGRGCGSCKGDCRSC